MEPLHFPRAHPAAALEGHPLLAPAVTGAREIEKEVVRLLGQRLCQEFLRARDDLPEGRAARQLAPREPEIYLEMAQNWLKLADRLAKDDKADGANSPLRRVK